ncbi:MAG: hypothetical protein ACYC3F_05595 [Gemmatimonadaceae bacterium]
MYLWLSDRLLLYPDSVREQVRNLVAEMKLCEQFAVFATLADDAATAAPEREKSFGSILATMFANAASMSLKKSVADTAESPLPNSKRLFNTRIALRRLGQILRYAASLDAPGYDETLADVRDNYDPNLVDKNKLGVLINLLRLQLGGIEDPGQRQRLLHAVDRVDAEIRRSKVRWTAVITGCFVLLGVLADLKSLWPHVYDQPLRTVESIIAVLHEDAQVQRRRDFLTKPGRPEDSPDSPSHEYPQLPSPPEIKRED